MTLFRNRHSRLNDHFGYDVDTSMILDGPVGDIPTGTTVHDALLLIQSGGDPSVLPPHNYADPALGSITYYNAPGWTLGPNIQDDDGDTFHTADGIECMRLELDEARPAYHATLRLAFPNTTERTYGFYGTNESDYSDLILLKALTFAPIGSSTPENLSFDWEAENPYRYYALRGPDEVRNIHEIVLYVLIGAATTSHPLLINRELSRQHPATAVSFDDTLAGLGETTVQGAIDKLSAHTSGGSGVSAVIFNATPGIKFDLEMPFAGTISAVRLLADQPGNIVIDLWKDSYTNYPPVVGDSICAAAKPTLVSADKYEDVTLTGWTTDFDVGDVIRANIESVSTLTRVTVALRLNRAIGSPVVGQILLARIDRTATARDPNVVRRINFALINRTAVTSPPVVTAPPP